ncbi:copper resistance protein CopC [Nocardioides sp. CFH 31398]|uniref:copper resistance CopC family protein n=1 Tax=Nocardioides sp. CFH 31398 TaxID=2919579 RepID=UPI001F055491|nr:copper resistance protein CopC [Nocardioides sp. CFH 31398]MCH1867868.1 copper resistance protein CopC [Nocardioides sp. CFH 31398]
MRGLLRSAAGFAAAGVLTLAVAAPASAHSDLEDASPGPGDDVATGSTTVHLLFGEGVEDDDEANQVTLEGPDGDAVAVGAVSVVDDGMGVCVATDALEPGEHTLDWRVMSVDGHLVQSRYAFEVSDGGEPADGAACEGADLAAPEAADAGGIPTPVLAGGGAVLLAAAVGAFVWRVRSDRRPGAGEGDTPA